MKKIFLTLTLSMTSLLFSQDVSQDINAFGFKLAKPLSERDANAVYSPFSLFTCFSLVASGAEEDTRSAMETGLGWTSSRQDTAGRLKTLSDGLFNPSAPDNCALKLHSANGLFAEQDTVFLPVFMALANDDYRAEVQSVDFSKSSEEAIQMINGWIGNETKQKIQQLLQPGDVDSSTRLVLVNALYFQGNWQNKFDKKRTAQKPFFLDEKTSVPVSMMQQIGQFRYFEDTQAAVAILPLCSTEHARPVLVIVLPALSGNVSRLFERMTPQTLQTYFKQSAYKRLDLKLPSFCLRKRYDLQQAFTALGMGVAFTSEADFSGLDGQKDLYLSKALHEGYFNLNEVGVEAAAATSASMNITATGPSKEPVTPFNVNRPFLFFLVDEESGTLLFAGKLTDPTLSQCK